MWKLVSIHDDKLSCENFDLQSDKIAEVLSIIEKEFKIEYAGKGGASLDGVFFDFCIDCEEFTVGWDCWSGLFICPRNRTGNIVVEKIFDYLSDDLQK